MIVYSSSFVWVVACLELIWIFCCSIRFLLSVSASLRLSWFRCVEDRVVGGGGWVGGCRVVWFDFSFVLDLFARYFRGVVSAYYFVGLFLFSCGDRLVEYYV